MLNKYSSWLTIVDNITENKTNFDLSAHIIGLAESRFDWTPEGKKLRGIITIDPGVVISSQNVNLPALTVTESIFRSYDLVMLINKGVIAGASGAPGTGVVGADMCAEPIINGSDGQDGGTALRIHRNVIISNKGSIYGGGGGGGGGGGCIFKQYIPPGSGTAAFASIKCRSDYYYIGCSTSFHDNCCGPENWPQCAERNCPPLNGYANVNVNDSPCCFKKQWQEDNLFCGETPLDPNWTCNPKPGRPNKRGPCNVTHEVAKCKWEQIDCYQHYGATGGRGRGYDNNLGTLISNAGGVSPGVGRGKGGDGGDWGQDGKRGEDGENVATGNTTQKRINAGVAGEGGLSGHWIEGSEFLQSYSGSGVRLGRES